MAPTPFGMVPVREFPYNQNSSKLVMDHSHSGIVPVRLVSPVEIKEEKGNDEFFRSGYSMLDFIQTLFECWYYVPKDKEVRLVNELKNDGIGPLRPLLYAV